MLITLVEEKLVINPEAHYDFSTLFVEDAVSLDHIVVEQSLEHFFVR